MTDNPSKWGNYVTADSWSRAEAGMPPLPPDGFIAHYITGVLYPASWAGIVPVATFALIAVSWAL